MKITGFEVVPFEVSVDRFGLGQPLPGHKVVQTLTKVVTDEGAEGHYLGGHFHGDQDGLLLACTAGDPHPSPAGHAALAKLVLAAARPGEH